MFQTYAELLLLVLKPIFGCMSCRMFYSEDNLATSCQYMVTTSYQYMKARSRILLIEVNTLFGAIISSK